LEVLVNKEVFDDLPDDLQAIVLNACKVANQDVLAEYTTRNPTALQTLLTEYGVELRTYPDDVLLELRKLSNEVVAEIAEKDAFSRKTYASYQKFLTSSKEWSAVSELAYLQARDQLAG
jgi:TRAP-type mannitol/chloroaromatic compound transport system substrate-binding protein